MTDISDYQSVYKMSGVFSSTKPQWQQIMLRVKDPKISVPFYEKHFGFKLLQKYDFDEWKFSVYFLAIPDPLNNQEWPTDPMEREKFLWSYPGVTLELTHNHGTENDESFSHVSGNEEPHRGFGHIAVSVDDVYTSSKELEDNGVRFRKRPDEGRMKVNSLLRIFGFVVTKGESPKGLAFALDPDGYSIEIVKRNEGSAHHGKGYTLNQCMLRVKDAKASIDFYVNKLGMKLVREVHFDESKGDFSLYFLQDSNLAAMEKEDASKTTNSLFHPVLELTHNHGTEKDDNFKYHDGNSGDKQGFGHIGFIVDDINKFFETAKEQNLKIKKSPSDGKMRNLGFIYDPDGYWIEIIQKGATRKDFL